MANVGLLEAKRTVWAGPSAELAPGAALDVQITFGKAAELPLSMITTLQPKELPLAAESTQCVATHRANKGEELTSFFKTVLQLAVLAHVRMPNINPVVLVGLPVVQLIVELVGGGVERVPTVVLLVAVVIVQNGGLTDGHPDDGAAVLVRVAGAAVAVAALRPQQDGRDVVDLVGGLRAGALLGDAAALAPTVAGVQDEGEEKDQEEECDETSLEEAARNKSIRNQGGTQGH